MSIDRDYWVYTFQCRCKNTSSFLYQYNYQYESDAIYENKLLIRIVMKDDYKDAYLNSKKDESTKKEIMLTYEGSSITDESNGSFVVTIDHIAQIKADRKRSLEFTKTLFEDIDIVRPKGYFVNFLLLLSFLCLMWSMYLLIEHWRDWHSPWNCMIDLFSRIFKYVIYRVSSKISLK